jgi:hypothetical protein
LKKPLRKWQFRNERRMENKDLREWVVRMGG